MDKSDDIQFKKVGVRSGGMDHNDVGKMWDENAEAWTTLARMGYDVYRDYVNTPAFMAMLPDVSGMSGADIGCGEGHNTRLIARRGAKMTALDISRTFLTYALREEGKEPLGIRYILASGIELPFRDQSLDFVTAVMSLMDMPEHEEAVGEAFRVLRPGGFLQFSIIHPCFQTPGWKWILDDHGRRAAMICSDYFDPPDEDIEEWTFEAAPPETLRNLRKFRVPVFRRTLSSWINLLVKNGFVIERLDEPYANEEALQHVPKLADTRIIAYFLLVLCRKPRVKNQAL